MGRKKNRKNNTKFAMKQSKKLHRVLKNTFSKHCESFMNKVTEKGIEMESEEMAELFDIYDTKWRAWARSWISRNMNTLNYHKNENRSTLTNSFKGFIEEIIKSSKKATAVITKEEEGMVLFNGINYRVDVFGDMLNQAGIKTKAKTGAGLKKALDKAGTDQQELFSRILSEF